MHTHTHIYIYIYIHMLYIIYSITFGNRFWCWSCHFCSFSQVTPHTFGLQSVVCICVAMFIDCLMFVLFKSPVLVDFFFIFSTYLNRPPKKDWMLTIHSILSHISDWHILWSNMKGKRLLIFIIRNADMAAGPPATSFWGVDTISGTRGDFSLLG